MFISTKAPQSELMQDLLPILVQASEILREEYQQYLSGGAFDVEHKSDNSPVTQADFRVNQYITQALDKVSDLPLLSEEGENNLRQQWQKFWMLDPLDGTKEFLHKRPEFTINLSLIDGSNTSFAVIAIPCENVLYVALEQGVPFKYNISTGEWFIYSNMNNNEHPLFVGLSQSSQNKPKYAEYLDVLQSITDVSVYKAGSAYKFCMILEDKVDLYPRFHPTSEWDTSAGQCLLERINGGLVDFQGRPFLYNQRDTLLNNGFIAFKNVEIKQIAFNALELMANKP